MKHKSLVKALEKAGIKVEKCKHTDNGFRVQKGENILTWRENLRDGDADCVHESTSREKTDSMTDYFPGYFSRTLKSAINHLTR